MRELTGSTWRVFGSQSEGLVQAMQEATNAISGIQLLQPTAAIRVRHEYSDEGGHTILVIVEGD